MLFNMSQEAVSVPQRLEHIESTTRDTAEAVREMQGSLATLLERSTATAQALANLQGKVDALTERQHLDAIQLAQLPTMRRDIDALGEKTRGIDGRVVELEKAGVLAKAHAATTGGFFKRILDIAQALVLAGIVYLFTLSSKLPPTP